MNRWPKQPFRTTSNKEALKFIPAACSDWELAAARGMLAKCTDEELLDEETFQTIVTNIYARWKPRTAADPDQAIAHILMDRELLTGTACFDGSLFIQKERVKDDG